MDKEKLMQKLKIKDYNKELEEILLNKNFSKNTKNLLSSMLYKIENSYEDYKKTKIEVPSKKELFEELIEIIARDCKEIKLVKLNTEENSILGGKKSISVQEEQKIITLQNELALLKAIYELNTNRFSETSNELNDKSFSAILNEGEVAAKIEVIRDFDGWSWNVMTTEVENFIPNLIYQSMVYLLSYNRLNKNKEITIKEIESILKEKYKPVVAEKIIKAGSQLAIWSYIKQKPDEQKVLKSEQKDLIRILNLMEDKKQYIEEITNQKKKYLKELERIDKYLYDDLALKREYIKQNEKLPQDQRVFSLSDFSEKIQEKRDFIESEIEKLTNKLKPQNFVKEKTKVEKELDSINKMNVENIEESLKEFISFVLNAINIQIQKIEVKKDIVEKIYILRYLKLINIDKENKSGDVCKKQFEQVEKNLITKGCNLKALNILSHNVSENYKIYKNIFNTKIIDLESAYIEIDKENVVKIYDENSLEKEEKYNEFKELTVKYNKKTKIFI